MNDPHRGPTMEAVVSRMKNANDVAPCEDGDGPEPSKPTRLERWAVTSVRMEREGRRRDKGRDVAAYATKYVIT